MTGACRAVWSTAARTTAENSARVREKNSPVPPAANKPAGWCDSSHAMCSWYGFGLNSRFSPKWVTGKESRPSPTLFAISPGSMLFINTLLLPGFLYKVIQHGVKSVRIVDEQAMARILEYFCLRSGHRGLDQFRRGAVVFRHGSEDRNGELRQRGPQVVLHRKLGQHGHRRIRRRL